MTAAEIQLAGRQFLPVMLSPMAGLTNAPFRQLCREFAGRASGADAPEPGLFVDEMVAARPVAANLKVAQKHTLFAPNESFRSMQIYATDANDALGAARMVAQNGLADHIDLNFGCPVRKVTSNGGGSALPWKTDLFRDIVRGVVRGASDSATPIIVTAKFRIGLDDDHTTWREAAAIAAEEGCAAVTLHARTAREYYSGDANWSVIKELREFLPPEVKVFGNGDVWGVDDAARMIEETGCDGVAIGRGALGKPWLFGELATYFATGEVKPILPTLGEVAAIMMRHLELLKDYIFATSKRPDEAEELACKSFRAHLGQYLKGVRVGSDTKVKLMSSTSFSEIAQLLATLDPSEPYPQELLGKPRGKSKGTSRVFLPPGWLDSREAADTMWSNRLLTP